MNLRAKDGALILISALAAIISPAFAQESLWPDLSSPPKAVGGGEKDAAVIVGAENYLMVAKVPGARRNAEDWQAYLTDTLKIPSDKVSLLRDNEATDAKMRRFASQAAAQVEEGGTLWFVFIGHGAPSKDGKDGLLVGADAQQDPDGLYARSLSRNELLGLLSRGKQARTVVLIDACFSGRSSSGEPLVAGLQPLVLVGGRPLGSDARTILLTAAKSDQFAGPLPKAGTMRPAFSYLALGALRGWAADAQGKVTASAVVDFARKALALDKGRTQTPELTLGATSTILGRGWESGPDLGKIDRQGGVPVGPSFRVSDLPAVPETEEPKAMDSAATGLNLGNIDVDALGKYDEVFKFDKGDAVPEEKAEHWRTLAKNAPAYAALAEKRAAEWDQYAAQKKAADEARKQRVQARDGDWTKLSRLLNFSVVPETDKRRWSTEFLEAYKKSPGVEPDMAEELAKHPQLRSVKVRHYDIPPGQFGVTLPVSGFQWQYVQPADRIDVMVTFKAILSDNHTEPVIATILQDVPILGKMPPEGDDQHGTLLLALNAEEAQYLALSLEQGEVAISRRVGGSQPTKETTHLYTTDESSKLYTPMASLLKIFSK